MSQAAVRAPSAFSVFRNRNFALLWTAQLIETIGGALTSLAASIVVFRETNSALSVGLMLMATAAPGLLIGLVAGVFVDRWDRKRIMVAAEIIRAVLVLLIPFLLPVGTGWLYILVFLASTVGQFFDPAQSSVIPEIASDEELAAANSLMAISSFGATAVGFAASGLIASQFSIEWAFYINALTYLVSGVLILFVQIPHLTVHEDSKVSTIFRNMRSGMSFLFSSAPLRSMFILMPIIGISFALSNTLLLPFATDVLGATEFEYGIQEGLTSLGFVFGSLFMARYADRRPEGQWIVFSFLGMGVAQMAYAFVPIAVPAAQAAIAIAIAVITVSGFMNAPSSVARNLVLQRHSPREMRGRVASVFFVTRDVAFLVGMVAAGLADVIGVQQLFFLAGLVIFLMGIFAFFLPGLGQAAVDWRRSVQVLRTAPTAPSLGVGRAATLADVGLLASRFTALSALTSAEREQLAASARVIQAPAGTLILRRGDKSTAAYFIISGKAIAGIETEEGEYRVLEMMGAGDFFGEIAALSGEPRTANVVAEEPVELFEIPATELRRLMTQPQIREIVRTKYLERLGRTNLNELPRFAGIDQPTLKELRLQEGS